MADKVFIALQNNEESRPIIEAIVEDNPEAIANYSPGMVKIDCNGRLTVKRVSIEEKIGREFDLQEIHINLISLSGNIEEDEDELVLERLGQSD
jgi:phenol hydroxylase P2 protein